MKARQKIENSDDMKTIFTERNKQGLRDILNVNIKDLHWKLIATAYLQTYFQEDNLNLSDWDARLRPTTPGMSDAMMNSAVCLFDFLLAHQYALIEMKDTNVADTLVEYVKSKKNILGMVFNDPAVSHLLTDSLHQGVAMYFGDMTVPKDTKFVLLPGKPFHPGLYAPTLLSKNSSLANFMEDQKYKFAAYTTRGVETGTFSVVNEVPSMTK